LSAYSAITALASAFFSWVADVVLYPIDTVSTRLKGSKTKPLVSTMTFILESFKKERRGLYRGVILTFPHSFIPTAVYVYIYERLLHYSYSIVDKW
jgi:hypothetical protein